MGVTEEGVILLGFFIKVLLWGCICAYLICVVQNDWK